MSPEILQSNQAEGPGIDNNMVDFETKGADYKQKIAELAEKKKRGESLSDDDKKVLSEAKNFVQILESKKDAKDTVKNQAEELRVALAEFTQAKNRIIFESQDQEHALKANIQSDEHKVIMEYLGLKKEDVKDINFQSALNLISSGKLGTDYKTWKELGYVSDGFFGPSELAQLNSLSSKITPTKLSHYLSLKDQGIKLIDVVNTQLVLNSTAPSEIYKVLFDVDNNGEVGDSDNQNIIKFKEAFDYTQTLIESGKESKLLESIGNILGQIFANREALYSYVKANPDAKYKLLKNITLLAGAGNSKSAYVSDVLQHGKEATKISLDKKSKIDTYINDIFDKQESQLDEKYTTAISDFESKIPADKKEQYKKIFDILESPQTKKVIFENIKLNGIGILASLVEGKKGVTAGASLSHKELDDYLNQKTKTIISGVNFDLGYTSLGGKTVPGIGASIDVSKDISDQTRAFGKLGFINVIPYAMAGVETQINADDIKKMGFIDLNHEAKYVGASINVSSLGWGAMMHYKKDQLEGIEQQEKQLNNFLNSALTQNGVDMPYITSMPDYEAHKSYYDTFAKNIQDVLQSQNFDTLPLEYKKAIISSLKTAATFSWRENMLKDSEKNGYKFSGIGVGIQFLAGFVPLPTFGVAFEKVGLGYKENQVSKLYATLAESLDVRKIKTQNDAFIDSIELTQNGFESHKALFRNFAQKHPKEWKQLITGDIAFDQKVDLVLHMLKTDVHRNTAFFKKAIGEMTLLQHSSNENDKKKLNDLVAQFFDISFKDVRNIEEVVLGVTVKKDGKYEGNYDFISSRISAMSKFATSEGLSSDFSSKTSALYKEIAQDKSTALSHFKKGKTKIDQMAFQQEKDARLFGFVASYKIDKDGKSLGKGMVEIPAGQVAKLEGKEKSITQEKDIKYILNSFEKTAYGQNTIEQILKQIQNTKIEEFASITKKDVRVLLETGSLNLNGKTIHLDRDFVYFLYGRCANESMGLRINKLSFSGMEMIFGDISPEGTARIQANTTNVPIGDKTTLGFGIIGGKEHNNGGNTGGSGNGGNNNGGNTGGSGNGGTSTGGSGNSGNISNGGAGNIN